MVSSTCPISRFCPAYVLVLSVTSICLQSQTFDLIKSSVCPAGQTSVIILSSVTEQIGKKWRTNLGQKNSTSSFFHFPFSHTSPGRMLNNLWTLGRPKFVELLSKHLLSYLRPLFDLVGKEWVQGTFFGFRRQTKHETCSEWAYVWTKAG